MRKILTAAAALALIATTAVTAPSASAAPATGQVHTSKIWDW